MPEKTPNHRDRLTLSVEDVFGDLFTGPLTEEIAKLLKGSEFFSATGASDDVILFEAIVERDDRTARLVCKPHRYLVHNPSSSLSEGP